MNMRGLGRGLDSLFGDYESFDTPKAEVKEKVVEKIKEVNRGAEDISIALIPASRSFLKFSSVRSNAVDRPTL